MRLRQYGFPDGLSGAVGATLLGLIFGVLAKTFTNPRKNGSLIPGQAIVDAVEVRICCMDPEIIQARGKQRDNAIEIIHVLILE
jgi:hypothetical protein